MKSKNWKLPVSVKTREPLTYVDNFVCRTQGVEFIDPYEFEDTLEFIDIVHGRSKVNFIFESLSNQMKYHVGIAGFLYICKMCHIEDSSTTFKVSGKFGFVKRGANYLLELVEA